jgi:hypothetical protein
LVADGMTDAEPLVLDESRALVVAEPVGLARAEDPEALIAMATKWADALSRVVEQKHLYATISGRKYPMVEAWMTIGRMDNIVAAESRPPIRHDDGSYEAFVELIRLSDTAVIGRASALCGTADDKPWASRSEPSRRSMAATRAVSRAFRAQYSWIMALAGYEVTPAEEMPQSGTVVEHRAADAKPDNGFRTEPWPETLGARVLGTATIGKPPADGQVRRDPEDVPHLGFSLIEEGGDKYMVAIEGPLAEDVYDATEGGANLSVDGLAVTVEGDVWRIPWQKSVRGKQQWMPAYRQLRAVRVSWTDADGVAVSLPAPREAESVAMGLLP